MNIIRLFFPLLMIALLAGCSEEKGGHVSKAEDGREAEMQQLVRDTAIYVQQEEERKQKQIDTQERPFLIGIVGPETGEEASYGLSVVNGALAAARRFNTQGGIEGKEIKVLHYNDENNMGNTSKIVSYLIGEGAIAIISAPTGASTFAPIHLINDSKTIFISIGSRRHIERSGEYVFRTAIPDEIATQDLIKYTSTELGLVNYALVTSSIHEFSLDLSSMFKKALNKNHAVIKVEADIYDTYAGSLNISLAVDAIRNSPDTLHGVIFTGGASEGVLLAEGLKKVGIMLPLIGGEDLMSADYLKGGDAVEGTLLYSTLSADDKSPKMTEFIKDYGEAEPDRFAALAYDAFMLLAEAIKTAHSTNTSRVKEALINRKEFSGVTGKTSFSSEGAPIKHPLLCKIERGKNGGRVVVLKH